MQKSVRGILKCTAKDYYKFDDSSPIKSSTMPYILSLRDGFLHPPIRALLIFSVTADFPLQSTLYTLSHKLGHWEYPSHLSSDTFQSWHCWGMEQALCFFKE